MGPQPRHGSWCCVLGAPTSPPRTGRYSVVVGSLVLVGLCIISLSGSVSSSIQQNLQLPLTRLA